MRQQVACTDRTPAFSQLGPSFLASIPPAFESRLPTWRMQRDKPWVSAISSQSKLGVSDTKAIA
jgi:hypothetical protein